MKTYIGIDNGVTGTIAVIYEGGVLFCATPVKIEQDYTKAKKNITRVDVSVLRGILERFAENSIILLERPMVNPKRFAASASALRCHEAELSVIELLKIPYQFIDSKEWQKQMLPKGTTDTKKASLDMGNRLFPAFRESKHPDRDSLLIAEWARRNNL